MRAMCEGVRSAMGIAVVWASAGVAVGFADRAAAADRAIELNAAGRLTFDTPAVAAEQPSAAPADAAAADAVVRERTSARDPWWTVKIEPRAWYVGPSGKLTLPVRGGAGGGGGGSTLPADAVKVNDLDLDSTRLRPAGEFTIAGGDWRFSFSGADYSHDLTATAENTFRLGAIALNTGDRVELDFGFGMYQLSAGYRVYQKNFWFDTENRAAAEDVSLDVHVLGGVRFYDVSITATSVGSSPTTSSAKNFFAEPLLGGRAEATIAQDFGIVLEASVGYLPADSSTFSLDLLLAFEWRPIDNVGLQIGWRQLLFVLESGDGLDKFKYDGAMAGLFGGVVIRF